MTPDHLHLHKTSKPHQQGGAQSMGCQSINPLGHATALEGIPSLTFVCACATVIPKEEPQTPGPVEALMKHSVVLTTQQEVDTV